MATPEKVKDVSAGPSFANGQKVVSARPMYSAEQCGGCAIQGIMMGTVSMSPSKVSIAEAQQKGAPMPEPWTALVIRLTADCKAVDGDKKVKTYHPGDEIMLGGRELEDLYNAANSGEVAFEVWIKPKDEIKLGGGRRMMRFEKVVNTIPLNRKAEKLHLFGRTTPTAPALPAHTVNGTAYDPMTGEIPG